MAHEIRSVHQGPDYFILTGKRGRSSGVIAATRTVFASQNLDSIPEGLKLCFRYCFSFSLSVSSLLKLTPYFFHTGLTETTPTHRSTLHTARWALENRKMFGKKLQHYADLAKKLLLGLPLCKWSAYVHRLAPVLPVHSSLSNQEQRNPRFNCRRDVSWNSECCVIGLLP
ncbi:hypothetical protein OS493_009649 [Desmophyllum pertusum]|uniref:Uncharacterized protein n=1 Tax=Desmophyllum pertusum TaxID=174260 RepID=A0A9W9YSG5_9CNID|nr:hypothetical protein OS493_009649 [Desmophyllum pertusum]